MLYDCMQCYISSFVALYLHVPHMYIELNMGCKISMQVSFCQGGSCIFEFSLLDFVKTIYHIEIF
jgi:hypothetical protein